MAKLICRLYGVRGRTLEIYDNKCIIKTEVTAGSVITGNASDGEKTIFYRDCFGLQFKKSGLALGFLQFETPSAQMNNQSSNFFSENTFTFEEVNGITNELMYQVYCYVSRRMEGYKYGFEAGEEYDPTEQMCQMLSNIGEKMIFFCEKCNDAYGGDCGTVQHCPQCSSLLKETATTRAHWRTLDPREKEARKNAWNTRRKVL